MDWFLQGTRQVTDVRVRGVRGSASTFNNKALYNILGPGTCLASKHLQYACALKAQHAVPALTFASFT